MSKKTFLHQGSRVHKNKNSRIQGTLYTLVVSGKSFIWLASCDKIQLKKFQQENCWRALMYLIIEISLNKGKDMSGWTVRKLYKLWQRKEYSTIKWKEMGERKVKIEWDY